MSCYTAQLAPEFLRFVAESKQTYEEFAAARYAINYTKADIRYVPFVLRPVCLASRLSCRHKVRPILSCCVILATGDYCADEWSG